MVNYALLCKDEKEKVSYYYDLDNKKVYSDKNRNKNLDPSNWTSKVAPLGAILTAVLGKFTFDLDIEYTYLYAIVVVLGLLAAIPVVPALHNAMQSTFFNEPNLLDLDSKGVKALYKKGEKFRMKLVIFCTMFLLLTIAWTNEFLPTMDSVWSLFVTVGLWWGVFYIFLSWRPLCSLRLRKLIKSGSIEEIK